MRVPRVGLDPNNPQSIVTRLTDLTLVTDGWIEFGEPQNPNDPTSAVLAGGTGAGAHNGTVDNLKGSWVEASLTATGSSTVTCRHNLYLDSGPYTLPAAGQPNVRWIVFGWQHDGTGITAPVVVSVYFAGGAVAVNAIDLNFDIFLPAGSALTVDGTHPMKVTLFFTRATR